MVEPGLSRNIMRVSTSQKRRSQSIENRIDTTNSLVKKKLQAQDLW